MSLPGSQFSDLVDGEEFDSIEEALLTSCPYCGTELEWSIKVVWNEVRECPVLYGEAFSCGVRFTISPISPDEENNLGYITKEHFNE